MLTESRHERILTYLKQQHTVTIQQLVSELDVSESTIRRDLAYLEEIGLLARVHGGAKRIYTVESEVAFADKAQQNLREKQQLALCAAQLVNEQDVIFLDAGTTTLEMIPHLAGKNIQVVTNGIQQAEQLMARGISTILLGGQLKGRTCAVIGHTAEQQLRTYCFQKVFMGMNGVDLTYGYTTPDEQEAAVKRLAMQRSNQVFVLADKDKIGKVTFCQVGTLEDATLITNTLDDEVRSHFQQQTTIKEC